METGEREVQAKTMLPLSEFNVLVQAARTADRSIAAEIRVAIRKHLDQSTTQTGGTP
jgi:hypothetical protein